jgi:hypothetical protein
MRGDPQIQKIPHKLQQWKYIQSTHLTGRAVTIACIIFSQNVITLMQVMFPLAALTFYFAAEHISLTST